MEHPPPPLTAAALEACLRSPTPQSFYLSGTPDFLDGCDVVLRVAHASLPAHVALLAARATAFGPLLAMSGEARQLPANPFGLDSLPEALLLLRLCYRPEDAPLLPQSDLLDRLPGLLPVLHQVGAMSIVGALSPAVIVEQARPRPQLLLQLLNVSCQLQGLEQLADESAASILNCANDACLASGNTPGALGYASLALAGELPFDQLCPAASNLLLRGAITLLAHARAREEFFQRGEKVSKRPKALRAVIAEDVEVMRTTTAGGSSEFELVANELNEPLQSDTFSIAGREWWVRLTPLAAAPDDVLIAELGEDYAHRIDVDPALGNFVSAHLETEASTLPAAGLKVHARLTVKGIHGVWMKQRTATAVVTPASPSVPFVPLVNEVAAIMELYDHKEDNYVIRIGVNLGISS